MHLTYPVRIGGPGPLDTSAQNPRFTSGFCVITFVGGRAWI
jgi:hypothetical protein